MRKTMSQKEPSGILMLKGGMKGGRQIIKDGEKEYPEQQDESIITWERMAPNKKGVE